MVKQMADDGHLPTRAQLEAQASTMGQAIAAEVEPSITTSEASVALSFFMYLICFAIPAFRFLLSNRKDKEKDGQDNNIKDTKKDRETHNHKQQNKHKG